MSCVALGFCHHFVLMRHKRSLAPALPNQRHCPGARNQCVAEVVSQCRDRKVKNALTGTYHAIKFAKYVYRYLAEVQFHYNRRYDMRATFGSLLRALVGTPRQPVRKSRLLRFMASQDAQLEI